VSWRDATKDLPISTKDIKPILLDASREKGKSVKVICSAIKLLLNEGSPFDAELFKEIMITIQTETEAKKVSFCHDFLNLFYTYRIRMFLERYLKC
jgi:hypothetical protein